MARTMNKLELRERSIANIHPESVGGYKEIVGRMVQDIKKAKVHVDNELDLLVRAAGEGEMISDLNLNPIAERYVVLQLLKSIEEKWIPEAQTRMSRAKTLDISNEQVLQKLELDNFELLLRASEKSKIPVFGKVDQDKFNRIKETLQGDLSSALISARTFLQSKLLLDQLRALTDYLRNRSKQFISLVIRMDNLVGQLETEATRYLTGAKSDEILPTLRVEVFESLDEPKIRLWSEVYHELFVDRGKYLNTFDRKILAKTISEEMKPEVDDGGRTIAKTTDQLVHDIRKAILDLGRSKLNGAIFGSKTESGLNIANGLDLEAKLVLSRETPMADLKQDQIRHYRIRKLRALTQLCGVFARINVASKVSLDDGVNCSHVRYYFTSLGGGQAQTNDEFISDLVSELKVGSAQVKSDDDKVWHDPHTIIVHDFIAPSPLYYFDAITGIVEQSYTKVAANESRSYQLHTDVNWEKALPNLNPRHSEIEVDWSFKLFVKALATELLFYNDEKAEWEVQLGSGPLPLGERVALAIYNLSKMHQKKSLAEMLDNGISERLSNLSNVEKTESLNRVNGVLKSTLENFARAEYLGQKSAAERMDGPVWRALKFTVDEFLSQGGFAGDASDSGNKSAYPGFHRRNTDA